MMVQQPPMPTDMGQTMGTYPIQEKVKTVSRLEDDPNRGVIVDGKVVKLEGNDDMHGNPKQLIAK